MIRRMKRRKARYCVYCKDSFEPDYKDEENLGRLITERGKIVPRRLTGLCAKHQRRVAVEIKHARYLGMLPFVAENIR